MEPEGLLSRSPEPVISIYHKQDESSIHPHII